MGLFCTINKYYLKTRELRRILHKLYEIENRIERIEQAVLPAPAAHVEFYAIVDGIKRKVTQMNLKVSQKLPLSVAFKDIKGNDAKVDGAPKWSVTAPELATLEVAEDGLSAVLLPTGVVGAFKVQVSADADLGEGVKDILGELEVELLAGDAAVVSIAAGEPTDL